LKTRRRFGLRDAVALAPFLAAGLLPAATALQRVHLTNGRAIEVLECRIEGGTATFTLAEGGAIAIPSSLVGWIEEATAETAALPEAAAKAPDGPAPSTAITRPAEIIAPRQDPRPSSTETAQAETIDNLIRSAAQRHHLEPELLAAVIAVESGYRAEAVSPKGAQGLMQLMPGTARELAVTDPFDAKQNIDAGAKYLRQLLDRHGDSYVDALAAYNAGTGRVARYKGLPPYRETVTYIGRVLARYRSPLPPPGRAPAGR
jgi:soluble lytic murein transglycosylase-like protein